MLIVSRQWETTQVLIHKITYNTSSLKIEGRGGDFLIHSFVFRVGQEWVFICFIYNIYEKQPHITRPDGTSRWGLHLKTLDSIGKCWRPGPNFIELLSTTICLAWNFFLDENRITNQISTWFSGWANNSWTPVTRSIQQIEIWLVILFLPRKKYHA